MVKNCAKNWEYLYELPFPDDIEAVIEAWGEAIPDDLLLIGGLDWFSWAKICKHDDLTTNMFFGEIRDQSINYKGRFVYDPVKNQNLSLPQDIFFRFYMSHLIGAEVVFIEKEKKQNPRRIILTPIDPDGYRQPKTYLHQD